MDVLLFMLQGVFVSMTATFFGKDSYNNGRYHEQDRGHEHARPKHRMQKRRDPSAQVKVAKDGSPLKKRERRKGAVREFSSEKRSEGKRERRDHDEKGERERECQALGEDKAIHKEELQVHHWAEDHKGQLGARWEGEEIRSDKCVGGAAKREQQRQNHQAKRGKKLMTTQRQKDVAINRGVEEARDRRADDEVKADVEKIERRATRGADQFAAESFSSCASSCSSTIVSGDTKGNATAVSLLGPPIAASAGIPFERGVARRRAEFGSDASMRRFNISDNGMR